MAGPTKAQLTEAFRASTHLNVAMEERLAALELQLEDVHYRRISMFGEREFERDSLGIIALSCRMAYLKNPLIKHGVEVQRHYVFGSGVSVVAKDAEINDVIQAFWDDPKNKAEFTDPRTMPLHDVALACEGNDFLTLFTDDLGTGAVHLRSIPFDEITDIICDPEDGKTPWFYKREWTQITYDLDGDGTPRTEKKTAYYADWRYETERTTIGDHPVVSGVKVMHVKVGGMKDMRFGVPEVYAAIDWSKATVDDLSMYMTVKRALARWANTLYVKGGDASVQKAKEKLQTTVSSDAGVERNPPPLTASTFIAAEGGARLDVLRTGGAQPHPEEGRTLRLMAGAALGIPETILMGDADVGNLATAKTLDRPTELKMTERQTLWKSVIKDICDFVIRQAIEAVNGPLRDLGSVEEHPITGEKVVVWKKTNITAKPKLRERNLEAVGNPDAKMDDEQVHEDPPRDATVEITFPNVVEHDPEVRIKAIVDAATLGAPQGGPAGTMTDRTIARMLNQAVGVDNIDEELDKLGLDEGAEATGALGGTPPPSPFGPSDGSSPFDVKKNGKNGNGFKSLTAKERVQIATALVELMTERAVVKP